MIAEIIRYLENNDLIAHNCQFVVAPAEISIMPHKELLLGAISNYKAFFLTNGFLFEPRIAESLRKNGSNISISIDSGTRETFRLVKGFDLFEKVLENLKLYKSYGSVDIKYNILVGVNDEDKDIDGVIDILKSLNIDRLMLSFDYSMPLRTAFYSIVRFVQSLKENGLSFDFHAYYSQSQIIDFISEYNTSVNQRELEQKNTQLSAVYQREYKNNYKDYRQYVYFTEIKLLIEHFNYETRFALLGYLHDSQDVVSAFEAINIPLQTPDLSFKESYDAVRNSADIFIIRSKDRFDDVMRYVESRGDDGSRLLNIERYYYSFEPTKLFLKHNIAREYLRG